MDDTWPPPGAHYRSIKLGRVDIVLSEYGNHLRVWLCKPAERFKVKRDTWDLYIRGAWRLRVIREIEEEQNSTCSAVVTHRPARSAHWQS